MSHGADVAPQSAGAPAAPAELALPPLDRVEHRLAERDLGLPAGRRHGCGRCDPRRSITSWARTRAGSTSCSTAVGASELGEQRRPGRRPRPSGRSRRCRSAGAAALGEQPVGAHDVAHVGEVAARVGVAGDDPDASAPASAASAAWRASEETMKIGSCPGPAWLNGRARTMSSPWASAYTAASRSPAVFETAYGFAGLSGASSSIGSRARRPYTSQVLTHTTRASGSVEAQRLEHVDRGGDVLLDGRRRVLPGAADRAERGEVVDDLGSQVARAAPDRVEVAQVDAAPSPTSPGARRAARRRTPRRRLRARAREIAAGEARRSGDQDAQRATETRCDARRRPVTVTACSSEPWPLLEKSASGSRRRRLGLGVHASLELAEHEPEQQMAPRRLRERAAVAGERGQLLARRVQAIRQRCPSGHSASARQRDAGPRRPAAAAAPARCWRRRRRTRRRSACAWRSPAGYQPSPRVTALPSSSTSS